MLTVLFATRNRAEILPQVLNCYRRVKSPTGGWKLVIVDNGSTDQTGDIIYSYQHRLELTYLFEPQPGKNVALNTGLSRIAGDLVLLTDDDAFPHKDWLVRMRAAADAHPDYAIFGGRIIPRWEGTPPHWIVSWVPLGPVFTVTDPLLAEGPVSDDNVFGPNMAVRADIFARGARFDPNIGPSSSNYAMGSETEFVKRLMRTGSLTWHCRDAVVEHLIPRSSMNMRWILRRAVRYGRGEYRLASQDGGLSGVLWLGIPRYIFREMLSDQLRILKALLSFNGQKIFEARWRFSCLLGQLIEARAMRSSAGV